MGYNYKDHMFYMLEFHPSGQRAVTALKRGVLPAEKLFRMYTDDDVSDSLEEGWITEEDCELWFAAKAEWEASSQ